MISARDRLLAYLAETQWELRPENVGSVVDRWSHPSTESLMPVPHELAGSGLDWDMIVNRLATVAGISVAQMEEVLSQGPTTPTPVLIDSAASPRSRLPAMLRDMLIDGLEAQGGARLEGTSQVGLPSPLVDVDALLSYMMGDELKGDSDAKR